MKDEARRLWRKTLKAWPLVVVLIATLLLVFAVPIFGRLPDTIGISSKPRVRQVLYPTFGNPAMVKRGTELTLEFDPREQHFGRRFMKADDFRVSASSTNDPYPVEQELPLRGAKVGYSTRWPEYTESQKVDRRIYLVTVLVPVSLPEDLYDLQVTAAVGLKRVTDYQPHSLSAVNQFKDHFSFCQLTDIHIFGPECDYAGVFYTERSGRPNGKDPKRQGAIYYKKVIDQINLMRPDFIVMTGDFMLGHSYFVKDQGEPWGLTTEYEYEMLWFYDETLRLNVPVFMLPGNHDAYAEGDMGAGEDWMRNWRKLYGPRYYSFDYGDYHFQMLDSQDWNADLRTLTDYQAVILPHKAKGQILSHGDRWKGGLTPERMAAIDETKFTGQLAWMRDDLKQHQNSKMRICALHQDPYRNDGSGTMWASQRAKPKTVDGLLKYAMGMAGDFGDGEGRLSAVKLMSQYRVALTISGHFHNDAVGYYPWADGAGLTVYANTTCTQPNASGPSRAYPGYRRIWIAGAALQSYNYQDPKWSYPWYAGTNVEGITDISSLKDPAIQWTLDTDDKSASGDIKITNTLNKPLPQAGAEMSLPYLSGGYYYVVKNGSLAQASDDTEESPKRRTMLVLTDVGPSEKKEVDVSKSSSPDTVPPAGSVVAVGGPATASLRVTLHLTAVDRGGSGVMAMQLSNNPDFNGASWQPYTAGVQWQLAEGGAGRRTVYARFRDYAMPSNVSKAVTATVTYTPPK